MLVIAAVLSLLWLNMHHHLFDAGPADEAGHVAILSILIFILSQLPVVHGIRIREPFDLAYIAFPRWQHEPVPQYYWGGKQYHRVLPVDTEVNRDLMTVLEGQFRHCQRLGRAAQAIDSAGSGI